MIPASFDYARPKTVAEAVSLLGQNPDAKILAGGHSLIPMMKIRFAEPEHLVDLGLPAVEDVLVELGGWIAGETVAQRRDCSVEEELHVGQLALVSWPV